MSLAKLNANTADLRASSARTVEGAAYRISPSPYFRWQAMACRIVAASLLIPGVALMACIILLVRLTSRGSAIYRQIRVGMDGQTFYMVKIRSMRLDAGRMPGPPWPLFVKEYVAVQRVSVLASPTSIVSERP